MSVTLCRLRLLVLLFITLPLLFSVARPIQARSRRAPKASSARGVTGQYRLRNRTTENTLDVLLLPGGKVKIYLYASWIGSAATGNVNTGEIKAVIPLRNGTALYESGECKITIRFVGRRRAIVEQVEKNGDCGFGLNVSAQGIYQKRSSRAPKFDF